MKNIYKFILCYLFVNFIFLINCNADLTSTQENYIANFAKFLIEKSASSEHLDDRNLPLIAYSQEYRQYWVSLNSLAYLYKDAKNINTINGYKMVFDCASFISYIYNHTLDLELFKYVIDHQPRPSSNAQPYTVQYFNADANANHNFKYILRNTPVSLLDLSNLKKGDIIIFPNDPGKNNGHIVLYIGDGKIAHLSETSITRNGSLGAEIATLKTRYSSKTANVIRIKDNHIDPNIVPNTLIRWPDTNNIEDIGIYEKIPSPSNHQLKIQKEINSENKYKMEVIFNQPTKYSFSLNGKNYNSNIFYNNLEFNQFYSLYIKDSVGNVTVRQFNVIGIDEAGRVEMAYSKDDTVIPSVDRIIVNKNANNINLTIKANDADIISGYSLDNKYFQKENTFSNLKYGIHTIYVKNIYGNVKALILNLTKEKLNIANINLQSIITKEVNLDISFTKSTLGYSYNITTSLNEPKTYLPINGFSIKHSINQNGKYYLWIKDTNGIITSSLISVNQIDQTAPLISKIIVNPKDDNYLDIFVGAVDNKNNGIEYSLDNINFQKENSFKNLKYEIYDLYIKDTSGNIATENFDLTKNNLNNTLFSFQNNYANEVNLYLDFNKINSNIFYNITNSLNEPGNWITASKGSIVHTINENGTYYLWTKQNDKLIVFDKIIINKIDKIEPMISQIIINQNEENNYNLIINAIDNESGIKGYSIDNINYSSENIFNNINPGIYTIYIKDNAGNIKKEKINLKRENIEVIDITFNNEYSREIDLNINIKNKQSKTYYNITNEKEKPNDWLISNNNLINHKINKNGIYYIWTKSDKILISSYVNIDKIDDNAPVITDVAINKISKNSFTLIIKAEDNQC